MEGDCPQAGDVRSAEFRLYAVAHFLRGVVGISEGEYFRRASLAVANEGRDATRQNGGFARAGPGNHQQRTVHVLDGFRWRSSGVTAAARAVDFETAIECRITEEGVNPAVRNLASGEFGEGDGCGRDRRRFGSEDSVAQRC